MKQALIGHTGFVGGVLDGDEYDARYNSSSIDSIRGRSFDRLVCAGVSAVKWKANAAPAEDWAGIERLMEALSEVRVDRFVLISTTDVYPNPIEVDETTAIDRSANHAYGRHRLALEDWIKTRFETVHIVRLPALIGPGLKKNIVFDLINDNETHKINSASMFQWYDLNWLRPDLDTVETLGLDLVNFAVEPVANETIRSELFPDRSTGNDPATAARYDMRTIHDAAFGGSGGYLRSADQSLAAMRAFVAASGAAA